MINKNKIVIAIDGPSASGKGSIARELSKFFNIPHLDTGKAYRIFALKVSGDSLNPNESFDKEYITLAMNQFNCSRESLLRNEYTGYIASILAKKQIHRQIISNFFKEKIKQSIYGIVLDGRDTAQFVEKYDIKIFITAPTNIRALRRFKELQKRKKDMYKNTLFQLIKRDFRDIHRKTSPLKKHQEAILINSNNKTIADIRNYIIKKITNPYLQK